MSRGTDPLERVVRFAERAAGDDVRATTFVRGLVLGALVGAAIAGSTIWQRRQGRSIAPGDAAATVTDDSATLGDSPQLD